MYIVQKFKKIVQIQKKRYSIKGPINTLIGFSLMFTIFQVARRIGLHFWPSHVENKTIFIFAGSVILHTLSQFVSLSIYLPGYLGLSTYHQKYEVNKRLKWPWKKQQWALSLKKLFFNLFINQLWVYPLLNYSSTIADIKLRFENFPSLIQMFTHVIIVYFIQDFFFYWAHRFAHSYKQLYKLHKIHHENEKIFTIATQYFHPIDFVIANVLPSAMGFIVLGNRVHCFTFFFWVFWKVMISTQGHSGYEFPWSPMRILPLVFGASYHDHHHSKNVGNFAGSCYFWDLMLQTGETYFDEFLGKPNSNDLNKKI